MTVSMSAIFHASGQPLEMRQVPLPEPARGEMLVRVLGCTLCGSDVHSFSGRRAVPRPTILGHEIVGEVVAMGSRAPDVDLAGQPLCVGDRVTWAIVANCGQCFYCLRGLPQKCLAATKYGHEALQPGHELRGGLAEYCLLAPGTAVARLPDELSLEVACPCSCATATVAAALEAAGELQGRTACVFGLGLLGLTATAMLRTAGAAEVVGIDVDESRRFTGVHFGATQCMAPHELAEQTQPLTEHGFDVVLELSGSPQAFEGAWRAVRMGGVVVLVGAVFPTDPVAISPEQIVRRNVTLRGIHNYGPSSLLTAVQFLSSHHRQFPFADLVDGWFSLENAEAAFQKAGGGASIRVGVRP